MNMPIEGHILVKNYSKIPHSLTRGQVNAIQIIWLDTVFVMLLGPSTMASVFIEFKSRKLEVIQVFISLRHSCSLTVVHTPIIEIA